MARCGWDSLTLDMQHGLIDYNSALQILIAISTTKVVPLVRIPWLEEGIIMKMLDAGAYGIICPMVNNKKDADRFALACKYPPKGRRSFGPIRAGLLYGDKYHVYANENVLAIAMIETEEAIENLDSILDHDEIQAVYIGPSDLSLALGAEPKLDQDDPIVLSAIDYIIQKAKEYKKIVGIHNATVDYAINMVNKGANFVTVNSDLRILKAGAIKIVESFNKNSNQQR